MSLRAKENRLMEVHHLLIGLDAFRGGETT